MVALWIARQSGGRTRLVLVGKPSGKMARFDLVITSAETPMPPVANLLPIPLPLMRPDQAAVAAAAEAWQERLAPLPRPLVAFLIGGPTGPCVSDASVVRRLLRARGRGRGHGRHRLPHDQPAHAAAVVATLAAGAAGGAPGCSAGRPRVRPTIPIWASLGHADGFVVTGRQPLDADRGHPAAPAARDPGLADRQDRRLDQLRRTLARLVFEPAAKAPAGAGAAGWRSASTIWAWSATPATSRPSTACCSSAVLPCRPARRWPPPSGEVPDDLGARASARIRALMGGPQAEHAATSARP